ncbi:LCP family protein [Rubneribacter sp.]
MVRRRQGFTAAQSKTTSRRLRTATLGTHVPRKVRTGSMNAESVGFSSARRQRRAARGFVNNVRPVDGAAPRTPRRMSHREFARGVQRRARVRAVAAVLACLAVVAAVAVGVGVLSLFGTLDGKLALKDSDAASALVPASADDGAFYAVVAANLDANGLTGAALVRVDAASKAVAAVSLPADLQVASADGEARTLRETAASGDAALIGAVASFAGVDVSHYVELDAQGLADLVDGLGGVEVEVAEEVDDPAAGDVYLPAGTQTLDGASALVLARATNFEDGLETQAENQRALLSSLSLRLLGDDAMGFLALIDKVGGTFGTDMSANDARELADSLRGMDASSVTGALVPGYESASGDAPAYVASRSAWASLMEQVDAGQPLVAEEVAAVDPGSFTLTVRNGGGVTGAAAQAAEALTGLGFQVAETGNADAAVYTETLVVYQDAAYEAAAETLVSALGFGRTVADAGSYTFETDVLLVLGTDWKPSS